MTALLLQAPATATPAPVRTRSARTQLSGVRSCADVGRRHLHLVVDGARVPAATTAGQLYWTPRGLAVALATVLVVVGLMAATLVASFLSVSNEPLAPTGGAFAAVVAGVPAR